MLQHKPILEMATVFGSRLARRPNFTPQWVCATCRGFSTSPVLLSGHNRWSQIKHDKAKNDKAKSKERQILVKEITHASQSESSGLSQMSFLNLNSNDWQCGVLTPSSTPV